MRTHVPISIFYDFFLSVLSSLLSLAVLSGVRKGFAHFCSKWKSSIKAGSDKL